VTSSSSEPTIENVIIVGSGPAGYTAALYTSRANLKPLVIEGFLWGGLLQQTTDVENYPGFPEGIEGPELMQRFRDLAERFGTRFITDQATKVELADEPGGVHKVWVGKEEHRARTVILAMGAEHKKLEVRGEEELSGRGVSYCATCDAAFFKEKPTMIVGGGDSAMEEAIFLSKFASKVVIVHRRDEFRASKIMLERARSIDNIEWMTPYAVAEFHAGEKGGLEIARLRNTENGEEREVEISGAFIAIGHEPQSQLVTGMVDVDDEGYVITEGRSTRTRKPGVFAAGDLVDHTYRQAVTAAGSGTQAALDAEWYLRDTPGVPAPEGMPQGDLAEAQWAPSAEGG
jgi:thioredoxin reductase (NADPH)